VVFVAHTRHYSFADFGFDNRLAHGAAGRLFPRQKNSPRSERVVVYVIVIGPGGASGLFNDPARGWTVQVLVNNLPGYGQVVQAKFGATNVQNFFQNLTESFSSGNVIKGTFGVLTARLTLLP